jgi:hypothetical protein
MKQFFLLPLLALYLAAYSQTTPGKKPVTCKLTSPELRQRKAIVIASLKRKIVVKKELPNGFAYQFKGSDANIDELTTFVKTERLCCDFFDFSLSVKGDGTTAWLTITGPKGAKEFIKTELQL